MHCWVLALVMISAVVLAVDEAFAAGAQGTAGGYRGIWYYNQETNDEYVYKYSGGLGTYCAKHIPLACYAPEVNKTFFCYGGVSDKGSLLEMVSCYDHATGTVPRPTILMDKRTTDAHDNVTIMLDDEGHVWTFCSAHGAGPRAYVFRSRRPYDVAEFEFVQETNFSYPQAWHMGERGWLFLHTRYEKSEGQMGRSLYWMTSSDGRRWSEPQRLARITMGHYQVSWPWRQKVGTAFNYHPERGLNWRTNLYYLETDDMGRTWRNAPGEPVEVPLHHAANPALVRDYQGEGLLVYMKDVNYDAEGRPIILYVTGRSWAPGPQNGPRTWNTAHWTGRDWEFGQVTASDNNYDTGCLHVEEDGAWRVIGPTETGPQPFNPGGEMALWISRDEGRSWKKERDVTRDSEYNHTYARRPVNAGPGFYALWADGHGRRPSESRIYFCDRDGNAFRLPFSMDGEMARPEKLHQ